MTATDRTMPRRPADTADVCAREGCGKSMAGRIRTAKFCSDKCSPYRNKRGGGRAETPPPVDGDRRLVWLGSERYEALARAASEAGITVDALVEQLLADVGDAGRS